MTTASASFRIHMRRRLRRAGIEGRFATVTASRKGLWILGETTGSLMLPWTEIERGRVGYNETKSGKIYEARLWRRDHPPLRFFPLEREDRAGYAAAMRILVQAFAERGRAQNVELGASKFEALIGPVMIGILSAVSFFVAGYAMEPPEWWHFIVIPFAPTAAFAVLTWQMVRVQWPRPLVSMEDIERQLPH